MEIDYKEKFEKAYEIIKQMHDGGIVAKVDIENAFPELKESEGERIRKALIQSLRNLDNDACEIISLRGFSVAQCISWLEMQEGRQWSEKDEVMRKFIQTELSIEMVQYSPGCEKYQEIADARDWLKTISPQWFWKPTEEQLNALGNAAGKLCCGTLFSLYEQLKKSLHM